jgi:hypothetical protein
VKLLIESRCGATMMAPIGTRNQDETAMSERQATLLHRAAP